MMASRVEERGVRAEWLADAELRSALERYVRRRLSADDARDVVQSTIADVLANEAAPSDGEGFRRFVFVVARNKVADQFRRHSREAADGEVGELPRAGQDPVSARDLLRWAEQELPSSEDKHTLEWMLREADGDKLEHIAEEANVPAPRVRQRVSRLRRYLRERWAAELAIAGALGVLLLVGYAWLEREPQPQPITRERPEDRGREVRRGALERCRARDFAGCVEGLDRAKALDPAGDQSEVVQEARRAAADALRPAPPPAPAPVPSASAPPSPPAPPAPKAVPTSANLPRPKATAESKASPRPVQQQKAPAAKKNSLDFDSAK